MTTVKMLWGAALTCVALLGFQAPAFAQLERGAGVAKTSAVEAREQATDRAVLKSLLDRRSKLVQSAGTEESKRAMLELLNRLIAQTKLRIGS